MAPRAPPTRVALREPTASHPSSGALLGGHPHDRALPQTSINKQVTWGDTFWPSPVFLSDGPGYTFWKDGLTELKVALPAK